MFEKEVVVECLYVAWVLYRLPCFLSLSVVVCSCFVFVMSTLSLTVSKGPASMSS